MDASSIAMDDAADEDAAAAGPSLELPSPARTILWDPELSFAPNHSVSSSLHTGLQTPSTTVSVLSDADDDDSDDDLLSGLRIDFVRRLCPELVYEIFLSFDAPTVSRAGTVSRTWRRVARDQSLWRRMCMLRWRGKKFHPLELHPIADYTQIVASLSVNEMLGILRRRGVILRPGSPSAASWPSSAFPAVSLWSWSWSSSSQDSSSAATTRSVPESTTTATRTRASWVGVDDDADERLFKLEVPWLKRLIVATTPLHAPRGLSSGCGKWMASYVAAEADALRTRITRMELISIKWSVTEFRNPDVVGTCTFCVDGTWASTLHEFREWWRLRRDGRPQINFYSPFAVTRGDDWGFILTNDMSRMVAVDGKPAPSLGANHMTDL